MPVYKRLDLSNFSVLSDNVRISMQGTFGSIKRGDPFLRIVVDDISTIMKKQVPKNKQH